MRKTIALLLMLAMMMGTMTGCKQDPEPSPSPSLSLEETVIGDYYLAIMENAETGESILMSNLEDDESDGDATTLEVKKRGRAAIVSAEYTVSGTWEVKGKRLLFVFDDGAMAFGEVSATYKDGVITLDLTEQIGGSWIFVLEGQKPPKIRGGGTKPTATPAPSGNPDIGVISGDENIVGDYYCAAIDYGYGENELAEDEYFTLKLGEDGYGTFDMNGSLLTATWKLEDETFTLITMVEESVGTYVDGVIRFKLMNLQNFIFVKEGEVLPGTNTKVFESPTTSIDMPSYWYGTMSFSLATGEFAEYNNTTVDIWGLVGNDSSTNKPYIEFYDVEYWGDEDHSWMSMYIDPDMRLVNQIIPDVGYEDAWLLDVYLEEEDEYYFTATLDNGALWFSYYLEMGDGVSNVFVDIFVREDGTSWDEENDYVLPSGYAQFQTGI